VRPDGTRYEGQFKDGLSHGWGKLEYLDGRQYTGTWKAGRMDGEGVISGPDLNAHSTLISDGELVVAVEPLEMSDSEE